MAKSKKSRISRSQLKKLSKRQLIDFIFEQERRLAVLEEKLGLNSGNSSLPPSKDNPGQAEDQSKERSAKRGRESSGRNPGGQPGHPKHGRPLVPEDKVDDLQRVAPEVCNSCGGALEETTEAPLRHQTVDLPEISPLVVSEVQLLAGYCPCCDQTTRASLPQGAPRGGFGPRVQSMVAYLSTVMCLSDRKVQEGLLQLFGLDLSLGSVANLRRRAGEAVADAVEAAKEAISKADVVHADETSWRELSRKAWLWTFVTTNLTVFIIRPFRSAAIAVEILGENFPGTVVSDRYAAYAWLLYRQVCWSHLLRDFKRIAGRPDEAGRVGQRLHELGKQLFVDLHRLEDGEIAPSTFQTYLSRTRVALRTALHEGVEGTCETTAGTCKMILKVEDHLWRFAREEGVEPTNNVAERAIRHLVIWRKIRLGTQSITGSLAVERLMTVFESLKKQKRDFLEFVTASIQAKLLGTVAPSLLPA